jgi:hypothetical protein
MNKKIMLLALVGAVLWGQAAWAQEFYVIAGGGAPGTRITGVPFTINSPGFYYLSGNLAYNGSGNAITVNADDVTIDLMGFRLANGGAVGSTVGIDMIGRANVEIRNGTVQGFAIGVFEESGGTKHRAINIRAINNGTGIRFGGNNHLIENCNGSNNSTYGLYVESGIIADCVASNNEYGITMLRPGSILGNMANNNTYNNFVLGDGSATSILVDRNSAFGLNPNYYVVPGTTGVVMGTNAGTP